jgi:hypothetical protein
LLDADVERPEGERSVGHLAVAGPTVAADDAPHRGAGALARGREVAAVGRPVPVRQPEVVAADAEDAAHVRLQHEEVPAVPRQEHRAHVGGVAPAVRRHLVHRPHVPDDEQVPRRKVAVGGERTGIDADLAGAQPARLGLEAERALDEAVGIDLAGGDVTTDGGHHSPP